MIWEIVIFLCFVAALCYPTMKGKGCALAFCLIALIPEWVAVEGLAYFPICMLSAVAGIILIHGIDQYSKYSFNLCCLLVFEIVFNIFGMVIWWLEISRGISLFLYSSYGIDLSPIFLYESIAILYYIIALYFIVDWRNRKDANGIGFFQFIGDFILSPFIRFKAFKKWTG